MKKLAVVIGRFQPVHVGHIETLLKPAFEECDAVLILVGSANRAPTPKDPWTVSERYEMLNRALVADQDIPAGKSWSTNYLTDHLYSDHDWVVHVQNTITNYRVELREETGETYEPILYGCDKDASTYYLHLFPGLKQRFTKLIPGMEHINATLVRDGIFGGLDSEDAPVEWADLVTPSTYSFIQKWLASDAGKRITEEYHFLQKYRAQFSGLKYPPVFVTVDNVIVYKGNILLVQRKAQPGRGLWALPGGFLEPGERIRDAAIREAREETNASLQPEWIRGEGVFDAPSRSLRGRTITHAYLWKIPDSYNLDIRAGSDAAKVQWFPVSQVLGEMRAQLFEDHADIIHQLTKKL